MGGEQFILSILSKLGPESSVFLSSFHTTRIAMGQTWKMPSMDDFIESLIHEQNKLIQMGALKHSKYHALAAYESNKKKKQKNKGKMELYHIDEESIESSKETLNPKGGKTKKEQTKCSYCNRGFDPKSSCMVNTISLMAKVLQQHNLADCIPDSVKKKTEDKPPEDQGKGHVLTTIASSSDRWILDSGASNHMAASKHSFYSLVPCTIPPMLMGDNTPMRVCGEGSVDLYYGSFYNLLHVPKLSMNLLSIYQITHSSTGKRVVGSNILRPRVRKARPTSTSRASAYSIFHKAE